MSTRTLPTLQSQLQQLVASPSVSATNPKLDMGNRGVIDLLAVWLDTLGFRAEIMPIESKPNKANLIATLGRGDGGLVLAGHTDTVPYDDDRWQSDPFKLSERDNRFYGLGSTDMKGFFPLAIEAAKAFADKPLRQPLIILATADEETSMSGARALVKAGIPKARYAVIGEPTGLKPIRMHKGMMMERLRITGQAGHSSNPAYGASALEAMHTAMGEILKLRGEWQQRYQNPGFEVQVPTLNLGCIHGGDNPNRICGHTELQFDLRPLPGMPMDELRGELHQRLSNAVGGEKIKLEMDSLIGGVDAFEEPAQSELVKAAEKLTGHSAGSVAFATEAPFLQKLGMQTIVLGPGDIDQAHQPDEYLGLDRIDPMVDILKGMIGHFCL
ncbi:acetylornithine deacetylase [Microbulbifer hydrolyticus]|uniref:Acetylornithine deacetylase n=1 Tax=Microbulbifer hydrolyticus TaxID=48074 RepID=A0A6P1T8X6_9GAMM|nr:acetylornithine deacetylase [Microbulbifer hydrolyticus]MBB5211149.1 acetylornithine deacetylase [Microbulbifer hydrolyticus]QHQ38070.1 acetylornithine deacetylase [Microbulbifer hydrolyticus]